MGEIISLLDMLEVWNTGSGIQEEFGLKLRRKVWAENTDIYD